MRQARHHGFSVIEMIVTITIVGLMMGIISVMHVSNSRIFTRSQVDGIIRAELFVIEREVGEVVRSASAILPSRTFGSGAYVSASDTIILVLPGIDAEGDVLSGVTDHAVIYRDPSDSTSLKLEVEPDASSSRPARTRTLSVSMKSMEILYDMADPDASSVIRLVLDLAQPYRADEIVRHVELSYALGNS